MTNLKHGHASKKQNSPTHESWKAMRGRCDSIGNASYSNYGSRGISYDPRWKFFENFLQDMGVRPAGACLERLDNDKGYYKENCRWASYSEQNLHRRVFSTSTTKITGVNWKKARRLWLARVMVNGVRTVLYQGEDFFEACCTRKSWESKNVQQS